MINIKHLEHDIITPTLEYLGPKFSTKVAVNLLIGTALAESELYHFLQINGPAVSIFQMEPDTYNDCWKDFIAHRSELSNKLRGLAGARYSGTAIPIKEMITNLAYATAMARIKYWRDPEALPEDPNDVEELAIYWKRVYNSHLGKGDPGRFITMYNAYRNA